MDHAQTETAEGDRVSGALPNWPPAGPAHADLFTAIATQPERVPCSGADEWTSDGPEDRLWAAMYCISAPCPAVNACQEAADEFGAKWGVWGGVDRFRRARPR